MKKLILLSLISSFLVAQGWAQCGTGKNDPEAKKTLDAVSAKFKTYRNAQASFTLKSENAAGKTLSSKKGTVYMKGSKYRVTIAGQEIFCDGSNVWTYDKNANEVTISKFENGSSTLTPQKIFTNFYDKDFLYKMNGEKKDGAKTVQEIELTPCDKSKPFHKVLLWVDKGNSTITSTRIMQKDGNRMQYSVANFSANGNVTDAMFVFDAKKYPGVEVVDLR
jgi:outer membrane lipoprotein carrier protein